MLLLAATAIVLFPALCGHWTTHVPNAGMSATAEVTPDIGKPDARHVAVGDATPTTAPGRAPRSPHGGYAIALDLPQTPLPGQIKPDANNRCPNNAQIVINGGCWLKLEADLTDCATYAGYVHKNTCYLPALPRQRQSASALLASR